MMKKDDKAFIFYFLMTIIFFDFGNQIKKLSYHSFFENFNNPIFSIVHANNTGSAFSLFQNQANILAIIGIIAIFILTFYVYKFVTFKEKGTLLSITLFCAGTLGNIVERIQFGYVIDYIKLNFINFPIFNSFDVMICTGIFIYITFVLLDFKKELKIDDNSNQK